MTQTAIPTERATRFIANTRAVAVTDNVQGITEGYVMIWGDPDHRDSYNTYFDPSRPPQMDLDNGMHRRPIKYEHCDDPVIGMDTIGMITDVWFDEVGLKYRAQLDRSSPHFDRVVKELSEGRLYTSSATGGHTGDFFPDGAFRAWTLLELSLTGSPSESRMPKTTLIRSDATGVHDESRAGDKSHPALPTDEKDKQKEKKDMFPPVNSPIATPVAPAQRMEMTPEDSAGLQALVTTYGIEAVSALLAQMQAPAEQQPADVQVAMSATDARSRFAQMASILEAHRSAIALTALQTQMMALQAQMTAANNAPPVQEPFARGANRVGEGVNINLIEAQRFSSFSNDELFLAAQVLSENKVPLSDGFKRSLGHRGLDYAKTTTNPDPVISTIRSAYQRADDFMASDIAGKGLEWTGTFYGSEVWQKARTAPIMDMLIKKGMRVFEVQDGASNVVIPLEGSDSAVFTTAQSNDKDATGNPEVVTNVSFVGTENVTVTPGELTTAVPYTDIMSEDSVLMSGFVSQLNFQINEIMARQPEYVFLNGDTTATVNTNINLIDGTPATGINKPAYMVSNGALKLALVTNTAMSRDGGALDDADFRLTAQLFDADVMSDPERTAFVVDPYTYSAALAILSVKTRDVAGLDGTLFTGKLPPMFGIDTLRSGQMAKANSSGKLPVAAGTLGRILAVYAPYWAMVWKRRLTIETARLAMSKTNVVIASMRLGFRYRSTTASAVSYNLTLS